MKKLLFLAVLLSMVNLYGNEVEVNEQAEYSNRDILTGPKEKKHLVHYLSAIGQTQELTSGPDFVALPFNTNVVQSFGFEHPVHGDNTKFEVEHTGIYLIGYDLGLFPTGLTSGTLRISTSILLNGDPISIVSDASSVLIDLSSNQNNQSTPISKTTIVKLKRGDVVQLIIDSSSAPSGIGFNAGLQSIFITEISPT